MHWPRFARASYLLACLAAPALSAQRPDSTLLPRVVVTATRVDEPLGTGLSAVSVLAGDDLRRAGVRSVADALRLVPGAAIVQSGGPGAQTSLFLRGGESDYVRVLIDGVPANDPGGAFDLANLTLDNVDRIEVVRGPASVLYGTDAVAGVVQVFTRSGADRTHADVSARVGRYRAEDFDASLGGGGARASGSLGLARHRSDGVLAFNNQYRNDIASGRLSLMPAEGSRASISTRLTDNEFHYPTDGSGNVVDRNAFREEHRGQVAVDLEQRLTPSLRAALLLSSLEARGNTLDRPDDAGDTVGFYSSGEATSLQRRIADGRVHLSLSPTAIATLGGEWTYEKQRSRDSSNFGPAATQFSADRSNRAAYAQLLGEQGRLSYSAGARYDDNREFGRFRTARLAVALRAWRRGSLRATLGTAFKAPAFFETFSTDFTTGNAELRPERSRSWEVAAQQDLAAGRVMLSATWFDQRFRDLIQYTFGAPGVPNYFNVAAAAARGLELVASARPGDGMRASASVTVLRTRADDAGFDTGDGATFVRGQRLLRRPPVSGVLELGVTHGTRATFDAALAYVGRRDDRDFSDFPAKPVVLPAHTRLDVGGEYRLAAAPLGSATSLLVRLENALGEAYQEVFNFPAPGRSLSLGLRWGRPR
jgi:vitamin B12 transporter